MSFTIQNVHLAYPALHPSSGQNYRVQCKDGLVVDIEKEEDSPAGPEQAPPVSFDSDLLDGGGGLLLPSLCHAHIHPEKCFSFHIPDASPPVELIKARATRLIRESVQAGVTTMRAHVEVDGTVGMSHVQIAVELKEEWNGRCDIRLCLFMQRQLHTSSDDTEPEFNTNAESIQNALNSHPARTFSALGSAPFIEDTEILSLSYVPFFCADEEDARKQLIQ